jgi:DNA gyrase inhibitor GyrI
MHLVRWTGLAILASGALAVAAPQAPKEPAKPAAPAAAPASDNKVATTDALHVLVLPVKGSYMQHQQVLERLGGYLAQKAITPLGPPLGRYYSDPSTPEADLSWEVGFPVSATVKAEAPFELKDIPAGLYAIHVHKGPYEELGTVWPAFVQWIMSSGYRPTGAPINIFQGDPGSSPQVELRMPVEK